MNGLHLFFLMIFFLLVTRAVVVFINTIKTNADLYDENIDLKKRLGRL